MLPDWLTGVQIEMSSVPLTLDNTVARGVLWRAAPGRYLLDVPEVARYLIENGTRVRIDPSPSVADADVLRFLGMTPLAALFFQRGILAFHAAAVSCAKGAVLIAGDSGVGKSTLLAALLKRGYNLLADDLAAVDVNKSDIPMVFPAFPELTLWSDAMVKLEIENGGKGKHILIMKDRFATSPQPLNAVFCLSVHASGSIEISAIQGAKIFTALTALSYNSRIADALLDRASYMRQAAAIARNIPVFSLRRPRDRWCADELAELVEKECR